MDLKSILLIFLHSSLHLEVYALASCAFPPHFKFGVATASYQIEGAWKEDGKGENNWDHLCHTNPHFVVNGDDGDIACDSYHKYKEDVAMLKDLGVDFYRFSLSWSRILPRGVAGSAVNQLGIDYYRNLTQELLDNGIEPMVTIYHWDLPQTLQDIGGWPNPELVDHYAYYARIVFDNFGHQVKYWATFNEPKQVCQQGYGIGDLAPAIKSSGLADYKCAHTLIKAHAKAYHIYDKEFRAAQQGSIGIVTDSFWYEPASDSATDKEAAERALQFKYGWFVNPIVNGNYPQVMINRVAARSKEQGFSQSRLPRFTDDEIEYNKGTFDYFGVNTYTTLYAEDLDEADKDEISYESDIKAKFSMNHEWEDTASVWLKVVPWGIRKLINWISKTYHKPEIFITENGVSDRGGLDDAKRINFYKEYLSNLLDAILADGVNVTRYTAWSLMDNFEWKSGYSEKFGLYSVDFENPKRPRTPKASAAYYTQVIKTKRLGNT